MKIKIIIYEKDKFFELLILKFGTMNLLLSTNSFKEFNWSLKNILNFSNKFEKIDWFELDLEHDYIFEEDEINLLWKYKTNIVYLNQFKNHDDLRWVLYCWATIPHLDYFIISPKNIDYKFFNKYPEIHKYISFKNEEKKFKNPIEMKKIFKKYPISSFSLDLNLCSSNNLKVEEFETFNTRLNSYYISWFDIEEKIFDEELIKEKTKYSHFLFDKEFDNKNLINRNFIINSIYTTEDKSYISKEINYLTEFVFKNI